MRVGLPAARYTMPWPHCDSYLAAVQAADRIVDERDNRKRERERGYHRRPEIRVHLQLLLSSLSQLRYGCGRSGAQRLAASALRLQACVGSPEGFHGAIHALCAQSCQVSHMTHDSH